MRVIKDYLVINWRRMWKYKYTYFYLVFSLLGFTVLFSSSFFVYKRVAADSLNFAAAVSFLLIVLVFLLKKLFIDNMMQRRSNNREVREKYRRERLFQKYTPEEKNAYLRLEEKNRVKIQAAREKEMLNKTNFMPYLLLIFYGIIFTVTIIIVIITNV
ncbi:hypothetical protein C4M98_01670 [Mycoplasmopsis pullorum]|uniref:hypothetical protein n=1 Tax=Mycoplasmopsis pullorum TaxID=48003 RepID=UPI001119AAE8|nr:hypothetical protein [Mycoplasmopsis pullorum]TNK82652.1 hypothetical protein C4M94_00045 [Mycoplasmopsis pullorum]TNK83245.1 hypothetical protein C4M80_01005 [Mycoplasmopsis pullorum]TNK85170.1 hypothetical protein C4M81_00145 [Mycoplasmopsis pullorum]TNK85671.1 hypothetical protein C4M92_00490 [Mycoplasmopsis pullorum]TNK86219.1 hypothetical protein C4M85_00640 [Mycoplasmopsis pullorum]